MPLIEINTLDFEEKGSVKDIIELLSTELSKELSLPIERIVVYWNFIKPNCYIYEGLFSEVLTRETHQPIVKIHVVDNKEDAFKSKLMLTIVSVLCKELKISRENIALIYHEIKQRSLYVKGQFIE